MTDEERPQEPSDDAAPEAVIQRRRTPSIVWLIPLVAALIGGWLAYQAIQAKGEIITITFKTAEGLEAGKTKIRYKNVEIGEVLTIGLSEDLANVVVTAEMNKGAEPYLTENARFWVVRARLGIGEISGLSTLFSGAYIAIDPGMKGKPARRFRGLESPPVVTADLPGSHFTLRAEQLSGLDVAAPVYFRRIRVGQVEGYRLEPDGESISIRVFVEAPHDRLVRKNTRFYNAGGVDVKVGVDGIQVDTEALASVLLGGVAFETPTNLEPGGPAEEGDVFDLYPNRSSINEPRYTRKSYYLLYFNETVRGLRPGAPVEFRGIPIGQVVDIKLEFNVGAVDIRIPVLIEIEPDRITLVGNSQDDQEGIAQKLVEKGLRAQLKTGSLLTGRLLVNMDFFPDAEPAEILREGRYPVMPTVPTPISEITASLTNLFGRVESLPIETIGDKLKAAADGVDRLVNSGELQKAAMALDDALKAAELLMVNMNARIAPEVNATLEEIQATLAEMQGLLRADAPLQQELTRAAEEMGDAARAIRELADYLQRHPEALLRGKEGGGS